MVAAKLPFGLSIVLEKPKESLIDLICILRRQ